MKQYRVKIRKSTTYADGTYAAASPEEAADVAVKDFTSGHILSTSGFHTVWKRSPHKLTNKANQHLFIFYNTNVLVNPNGVLSVEVTEEVAVYSDELEQLLATISATSDAIVAKQADLKTLLNRLRRLTRNG